MKGYLLSIIVSACFLALVSAFTGPKSTAGSLIKLIGGLYLLFVIIQPLAGFDFDRLADFAAQEFSFREAQVASGQSQARNAMAEIIKQECEAYIMDKASACGITVRAEVTLSEQEIPVPEGVTLSGLATPVQRERLEKIIETDLNIPKENQLWTGMN